MENTPITKMDGQAPARRFGGCLAVVITLLAVICVLAIWFFTSREGIEALTNSIQLQGNGQTTVGTVTGVDEYETAKGDIGANFRLYVSFEVDGTTYSIRSQGFYPSREESWVGQQLPIIYDPEDPNIALIDTFQERWFEPITAAAP